MKTLRNYLGPHSGLNADWSTEAWPLTNGHWLLDAEDGTFILVYRKETEDGYEITELGTLVPKENE